MADSFADMPATVAPTLPLTFVGSELQNRPLRRTSAASGRSPPAVLCLPSDTLGAKEKMVVEEQKSKKKDGGGVRAMHPQQVG